MNERTKELAEQCYHRYSEHHIDLEKFAELIINECAEIDFFQILRSTCGRDNSEELAELISNAIKAKGVTE